MPVVKNLTNNNIVVFNKILEPYKTINLTQEQLDELNHLVDTNQIKVEIPTIKRQEIEKADLNEDEKKEILDLKERVMSAFFALHFNQQLSQNQLNDLKWFFKTVGPTSQLDNETKNLIDDVNSDEELIEVLLNHLYPELINNHFIK